MLPDMEAQEVATGLRAVKEEDQELSSDSDVVSTSKINQVPDSNPVVLESELEEVLKRVTVELHQKVLATLKIPKD